MYICISVIVIAIFSTAIVKMFIKDNKHDLEIQAGKFKLLIKKHDKE